MYQDLLLHGIQIAGSDSGQPLLFAQCKIRKGIEKLGTPSASPNFFLRLSVLYQAGVNPFTLGFVSTLESLKDYSWIPQSTADECVARLESATLDHFLPVESSSSSLSSFSYQFEVMYQYDLRCATTCLNLLIEEAPLFQGQFDLVTTSSVWEFKCTRKLQTCDFLQLALYAWLWYNGTSVSSDVIFRSASEVYKNVSPPPLREMREFKLYNVLSEEMWELDFSQGSDIVLLQLNEVLTRLLAQYYRAKILNADEEFLTAAAKLAQGRTVT